jgi:probable H4MPT-linked C1 transfer pathway protein
MTAVLGWDLGGANLKLARIEAGRVLMACQVPCPILADRRKFDQALDQALAVCPLAADHAVTMTGELSDVFGDRAEGVAYLVGMMRKAVGDQVLFYAGGAGFLDADQAVQRWREVASANWRASATVVTSRCPEALFVDTGTTTTDLIPVKAGAVAARGCTDGERLAMSELAYTGVVRTPVMAVTQAAPFEGRSQRIAAERFATMADVWRLVGDLPEDADPYPAADQRGKSAAESTARLARMLGRDKSEAKLRDWVVLARYFADCQIRQIEGAARTLVDREALDPSAPVIGAGCGRFVARRLAERLERSYRDFTDLLNCAGEAREMAARAAPAVAVALLAETGA